MSKTKGLADLKPRTVNPRTMTDEDRARLGKTLREFGDLGGVVLNTKTKQLVGGHQRVNDFRSDPDAKVVIERKLPKPDATGSTAFGYVEAHGTRYSYREVSWPKAKEAAANLAANRVHGDFDWDLVENMLTEFDPGFDLDLTGFGKMEFERLTQRFDEVGDNEVTEELQGMPEFIQDGIIPHCYCVMKFKSDADMAAFEALLGYKLQHKKKTFSAWFPQANHDGLGSGLRFKADK